MKIAIFDSGIGGLSVLHEALKKIPNENFLYFADEKNVPYGTKTEEVIIELVDNAINFILKKDVKAIVVGCNTATSVAINKMREKYSLPIIGMEPAVKKAIDSYKEKRILVIATPITIKGKKLKELISRIDSKNLTDLIALPKLVEFAEKEIYDKNIVCKYLEEEFKNLNLNNYSSVVLGCTHFNYFKDSLRDIFTNEIKFYDGNEGTINKLIFELKNKSLLSESKNNNNIDYYSSCKKIIFKEDLERFERYLQRLERMRGIK